MRWTFGRRKRVPTYRIGNPNLVRAAQSPLKREDLALREERENPSQSLTAGGELVRHGQASLLRRLIQPWQVRAFGYYDLLGEVKFSSQFYSRSLALLILLPMEMDPKTGELKETTNQKVIDALARIKDPGGGGRQELLATYGRLMFLVGEALLFVSNNPETGLEQWEMLSTDELRLLDGYYTRFKAPSLPATSFRPAPDDAFEPVGDDSAVAYRLWKKHPRFSQLADSTMQGVLDVCEELVLLTQVVRARARSRLAGSGILFLDDRISTAPAEPAPDEDPMEDPFIADLTDAMTSPITDEGTASAVVPLVARVRVPDGMKLSDLVYHLQVVDPTQLYPETGLRTECIKRMAIGLDMPPTVLTGIEDVNHWSGWVIDDQVWTDHLQPIANQLVQDLTSAYLGPYLKEEGLADWDTYSIGYDASAVINHPDRSKDALLLYNARAIGKKALRQSAGFDENDAPTNDELNEMIGVAVHDGSLALFGEPSPRGGFVETSPGVVQQPALPGTNPPPADPDPRGAETEHGPPVSSTVPGSENVVASGALLAARIEGAAQLGLLRARECAGAKIRTATNKAGKTSEAYQLIDGVAARDVASRLGRTMVRELIGGRPNEPDLVAGSRGLIMDGLRIFGLEDVGVAEVVAKMIEDHAARTLYDARPSPLPPTFTSVVTGLIEKTR